MPGTYLILICTAYFPSLFLIPLGGLGRLRVELTVRQTEDQEHVELQDCKQVGHASQFQNAISILLPLFVPP